MSHRVHRLTHGQNDQSHNLLLFSNVHFVAFAEISILLVFCVLSYVTHVRRA